MEMCQQVRVTGMSESNLQINLFSPRVVTVTEEGLVIIRHFCKYIGQELKQHASCFSYSLTMSLRDIHKCSAIDTTPTTEPQALVFEDMLIA